MILRHRPSLGALPEIMVVAFMSASISMLCFLAVKVITREPLVLVPNASRSGWLAPALADGLYIRSFAESFLDQWLTWTQYSYAPRRRSAIVMMTPSVRDSFIARMHDELEMLTSMAHSESFTLGHTDLDVDAEDTTLHRVRFSGDLRRYYGGVGGQVEACRGALLLREVTPTVRSPLCLEVCGFIVDQPAHEEEEP